MRAAESSGQFDYDPNYVQPAATVDASRMPLVAFAEQTTIGSANGVQAAAVAGGSAGAVDAVESAAAKPPAVLKRKNSLDEFELEIEGINLDDNIDTSVS